VRFARKLVELETAGEDMEFAAVVMLVGRDVADRAVAMFPVVPADEAGNSLLRRGDASKWQTRIRWGVL